MKKIVTVVVLSMISLLTFADIAVLWNNEGYTKNEGNAWDDTGPVLTQLIWSPINPVAVVSAGGGLAVGEVELDTRNVAWGYFADNVTAQVVDDLFVSAPDVNAGYLFVRTWNVAGTYYNQTITIDPTLEPYVATDTGTIIAVSLVPTDAAAYPFTNVEAIPEPATLGLMGIAGLGMFLARKKARR